jgi:hypothetical protein
MEQTLSQRDVTQAIKDIINLTGVYYVADDGIIKRISTDKPLALDYNGKTMEMRVYQPEMPIGEYLLLNPYNESIASTKEREWFILTLDLTLRSYVFRIIKTIIEAIIQHKDNPNEKVELTKLPYVTDYIDLVDKNTLKEFEKFNVADQMEWVTIFYHRKLKTAQLQSSLYDDEFKENFEGKIRQKTWNFFQQIVLDLLKVADAEAINTTYKHTATVIGCQETDAYLHVFAKVVDALYDPIRIWLEVKLDLAPVMRNLENIEKFRMFTRWVGNGTSATPSTTNKAQETNIYSKPQAVALPPWDLPSAMEKAFPPPQVNYVYGGQQPSMPMQYNQMQPQMNPMAYARPVWAL